jgi:hypothetical protein
METLPDVEFVIVVPLGESVNEAERDKGSEEEPECEDVTEYGNDSDPRDVDKVVLSETVLEAPRGLRDTDNDSENAFVSEGVKDAVMEADGLSESVGLLDLECVGVLE